MFDGMPDRRQFSAAAGPHDTRPTVRADSQDGWAHGDRPLPSRDSPATRPLRRGAPPEGGSLFKGPTLRLNNSLHASDGLSEWDADSVLIKWYACGPTVYDMAHLGHARTYLSFDIIRRILEDYFHKHVHMVMGVTDVDDKIIIRTRQINELLAEGWGWEQARIALAQAPCGLDTAAVVRHTSQALAESGAKRLSPAEALATVPGSQCRFSLMPQHPADPSSAGGRIPNEGLDTSPLTREMERRFWGNMETLGVRFPRAVTRVTEHIAEIIHFVETLVGKGYAYESNGSVYFNTEAFHAAPLHQYAKLVPSAADDPALATAGEGALSRCPMGEKRSRRDFALWKSSRPEEPRWRSPWGYGRPGWHVECAAMASEVLGENIDLHSGGEDLKFPHHDNELASAEAYWGHSDWCRVFLHSGHLHIDGRKMAKSQRNFISIDAALQEYTPQQLRFLFLLHHYDAPMMFGINCMQQALQEEEHWASFFARMRSYLRRVTSPCASGAVQRWGELEERLSGQLDRVQKDVHAALCDNFNTPKALAHLRALAKATREYIHARESDSVDRGVRLLLLDSVDGYCKCLLRLFGLQCAEPAAAAPRRAAEADGSVESALDLSVAFRQQVRAQAQEVLRSCGDGDAAAKDLAAKLLATCDSMRAQARRHGVQVEDSQFGSSWRYEAAKVADGGQEWYNVCRDATDSAVGPPPNGGPTAAVRSGTPQDGTGSD
eukprot:TRINITY_DN13462_c0_g1_i1.p1 TRINITY_DN13462_c0_g1~~TRINITY_DN13462_c0_g1_i1.p1  ORF type:complete len:720 (+),score=227.44 TRINITY_DN13462_c0_g1_i1:56-2215(+)